MARMPELGHVVFYVCDLPRSLRFYVEVVGLTHTGTVFGGRAAVLTGRTHHELLLIEMGEAPGPMQGRRLGLYHVGRKIGDSLAELRAARDRVRALGYTLDGIADHTVSQSLYLRGPDGNEIELFVDDPNVNWREDTRWLEAPVEPLIL